MAVRLSALRPGRPFPPGRFLILISVRGSVDPRAIVRLEGLGKLKNPITSSDLFGNRIRDRPACSIVPQPTTLLRSLRNRWELNAKSPSSFRTLIPFADILYSHYTYISALSVTLSFRPTPFPRLHYVYPHTVLRLVAQHAHVQVQTQIWTMWTIFILVAAVVKKTDALEPGRYLPSLHHHLLSWWLRYEVPPKRRCYVGFVVLKQSVMS
jgi:hypothetical protein